MTIFDVLYFNRELILRLRQAGIRLDDADFVDLFVSFTDMVARGEKVSYAVAVLAQQYGVSERKVYSLIARFKSHCASGAV